MSGTTDERRRGRARAAAEADWLAAPSPCVGVCRYEARKDRCLACAMTTDDKHAFKRLDDAGGKRAFLVRTVRRLARQGGLMRWLRLYARKCRERGLRDVTRGL